jgi:hypothetical protein
MIEVIKRIPERNVDYPHNVGKSNRRDQSDDAVEGRFDVGHGHGAVLGQKRLVADGDQLDDPPVLQKLAFDFVQVGLSCNRKL